MPATALATVTVPSGGVAGLVFPAGVASDAVNGNSYANDGTTVLYLENSGASSRTVTFTTTATVDGNAVADPQITLAAGEKRLVPPLKRSVYGDTVTFTASNAEVLAKPISVPNLSQF